MSRFEIQSPILEHQQIAPMQFELTLLAPEIARAALPGQFVQLRASESYHPLLRRPFSIYRADAERGAISVLYMARGLFTHQLSSETSGKLIHLTGPLGSPFPFLSEASRHILVAGGIGAPPLLFFASRILPIVQARGEELIIINGSRTKDLLISTEELVAQGAGCLVCTDDGSIGVKGIVTEILDDVLKMPGAPPSAIYACGPSMMMKAVADVAAQYRQPCLVSLDTPMPCGIGSCNGCMVKIQTDEGIEYQRGCMEGPVFDASKVVWE